MTHNIREDDSDTYVYKEEYKKVILPPKESLIAQLEAHYSYMKGFEDEKHEHKKNVLLAAIAFLKGTGTFDDLIDSIKVNPSYNQAIFPSETKNLVVRSIELAPEKSDTTDLNQDQKQLILELQTHLNSVSGKTDDKHQQKQTVITMALEVMNGKASLADLNTAMTNNPRYDEAFFTSKTETLITQTLELAKQLSNQPTLK